MGKLTVQGLNCHYCGQRGRREGWRVEWVEGSRKLSEGHQETQVEMMVLTMMMLMKRKRRKKKKTKRSRP
jgi:hypothetical protein